MTINSARDHGYVTDMSVCICCESTNLKCGCEHVKIGPSAHEYADAHPAESVTVRGRLIGDLVEFFGPLGSNHRVVLTVACRPYSNGSFATRLGALNYMKLIGGVRQSLN